MVEASESAKDFGQLHAFVTFLKYFLIVFPGQFTYFSEESESILFKEFFLNLNTVNIS